IGSIFVIAIIAITGTQTLISLIYMLLTISFSMLNFAYFEDPRVAFILPEKVKLVVLVNSSGILKYSKYFSLERDEASTAIVSGGLKAVSLLLSDFLQREVTPKLIQFEENLILIKSEKYYFLAVFADRDSQLLREAMENTAKEINKKFADDLPKIINGPQIFDLDDIFKKTFYFIDR
ncbi:MAG: hypothetical protein D6732_09300, partial [Methanobacteriota archaeon]